MQSKSVEQKIAAISKSKDFGCELSNSSVPVKSEQKDDFDNQANNKCDDYIPIMTQPSVNISRNETKERVATNKYPDLLKRSITAPTSNESLIIGSRVEARVNHDVDFTPGKILRVRYDGTFDVYCDDGQRFLGLEKINIRPLKSNDESNHKTEVFASDKAIVEPLVHHAGHYEVGTKVEARYRGNSTYYSGIILRSRFDGSFDIQYDDGDREFGVPKDFIRMQSQSVQRELPEQVSRMVLGIGTRIEAYHKDKGIYCSGKILRKRFDGTFDVLYDDGQRELGVSQELIRYQDSGISTTDASLKSNDYPNDSPLEIPRMHSSKKLVQNSSSSSSSLLDNHPSHDPRAETMKFPLKSNKDIHESFDKFSIGDRVESRFRGGPTYFLGTIAAVHDDDFYSVSYDDGDLDDKLNAGDIRRVAVDKTNDSEEELFVGDEIEAIFGGSSHVRFYTGKIVKVHQGEGTYDIDYHDGDKEKRVPRSLIKRLSVDEPSQNGKLEKLAVGDCVTARFKGTGGYYPGKVSQIYPDNTVDIDYDDGDKDNKLNVCFVTKVYKKSRTNPNYTKDLSCDSCAAVSNNNYLLRDEGIVEITTEENETFVPKPEDTVVEQLDGSFILSSIKVCVENIKRFTIQILKSHTCADSLSMHNFFKSIQGKDDNSIKIISIVSDKCLCYWVAKDRFVNDNEYTDCLKAHHAVMQSAMKCKRTLDETIVEELELAVSEIEKFYAEQ